MSCVWVQCFISYVLYHGIIIYQLNRFWSCLLKNMRRRRFGSFIPRTSTPSPVTFLIPWISSLRNCRATPMFSKQLKSVSCCVFKISSCLTDLHGLWYQFQKSPAQEHILFTSGNVLMQSSMYFETQVLIANPIYLVDCCISQLVTRIWYARRRLGIGR